MAGKNKCGRCYREEPNSDVMDGYTKWKLCAKCEPQAYAEAELSIPGIPAEDRYGRGPNKVKPLAQYLAEYLKQEVDYYVAWRAWLEQALNAYESTEQVKIRIERV